MRNIYLIKFIKVDYDEYDAFVVIAEFKSSVLRIIKAEHSSDWHGNLTVDNIEYIKKIGTSKFKEQIVLGSFNAG